ncbi:TPA: indole-3-glycerol-phosphate synthase TrpC, partial [Candidatus Galligastranaerophilus intestinigallinarum]|nr:indole-3-glycerol-phosphate synthase TrpC [Candidatus Galligastranaerophilus intestinigallinarum]
SKFLKLADSLNLSALVEAHSEDEVQMAIKANARIIGVNNRNLKTFEVDFNNSLKLRKLVPNDILFVSESGIKTRDDIIKLQNANVNAALIGETFMRSEDKIAEIKKLRGEI